MSKKTARSGKSSCERKSASSGVGRLPKENWRETRTASQCLSHLCLSEYLSDISFTFKDNHKIKLPAHKFLLSMRSEVFEAMFYGSLAEKGETVLIEDIKPEVMKTMLRFVYTDNPEINGENALPCLYAAKKYNLPGLINQCSNYLEKNYIDIDNVCLVHEQAVIYEMKPLQKKCFAYILDNAPSVFSSPGFLELSKATLLDILKDDELAGDEIEIFQAAIRWAKDKSKHNNKSKDGQTLRNQLGEALFQIRFPIIPIEEFAQNVTSSAILTKDELLMIYQYNATKDSTSLGKFCARERSGALITIALGQYIQKKGKMSGCYMNIQECNKSVSANQAGSAQCSPKKKSARIKSVTGTFVGYVKAISIEGTKRTDYEIVGKKITFENPIDVTGSINIQFLLENENAYRQSNYVSNYLYKQENIKGQLITINNIPDGLENITFVCK
ncbi:BTB/POZ domain-containing protein 3-like isoform X2 [Ruditapes philippinarum]|nr:BTB/POZ domain-containing protein 3-like isoform X2 [Ruditapes philippinarum]XP_060606528.1 BTB/POZ domain-containing protein 3-like isoform X2 [Ruditapes philippinarum]